MFNFKKAFSVFSLFTLLILTGAGCNPFADSPEEKLSQMRQNMAEIKTMNYSATISLSDLKQNSGNANLGMLLGEKDTPSEATINLSGQTAINNYNNPDSRFDISLSAPNMDGEIKLNARTISGKTYLKLGSLGPLQSSPMAAMIGSAFVEKWIELPKSNEKTDVKVNEQELTEEQKQKIKNLAKNTKFFKTTKDLGTEQLNEKEVFHYQTKVSADNLNSFINEVEKITKAETKKEQKQLRKENIQKLADNTIDIWVGSEDNLLYKLSAPNLEMVDKEGKTTTGSLEIEFSNYNQEISVEKPGNAKSMKDLFGGMFGGQNTGSGFNMQGQGNININPNNGSVDIQGNMNGMNLEQMKQMQQ